MSPQQPNPPSPQAEPSHERLSYRLSDILFRLNCGEALDPLTLAEHYQVSARTIQRDFNERFAYLPLQKIDGKYHLAQSYLGKLDFKDIKNFAVLAGVAGMFPSLDRDFIRQLLDSRTSLAYSSKGQMYEDANDFTSLFNLLEPAILQHHLVRFGYKGQSRSVAPYRLIAHRGRWYLAATRDGVLKAYRLGKISNLHTEADTFSPQAKIVQDVNQSESIWFGGQKQEVVLTVDAHVASHFSSRQLLPEQQLIKTLDNGSLIVASHVVDPLQILPLVRYWIPYVRIISTDHLRAELEEGLREYVV